MKKDLIIENLKLILKRYENYYYNQVPFDPETIEYIEDNIKALESLPEDELYRKVYIKSEEDLPKETGYFTVLLKNKSSYCTDMMRYEKGDNSYWLTLIDWYLLRIK